MSVKPEADILITGASSGIGLQLALDYANQGLQVIACGQNQERLAALSAQSNNIQTLAFNVTDLAATQAAFDSLAVIPKLIILNAGTCEYIDNGHVDTALFKRVFDVNVFGLLHCVEAMQHVLVTKVSWSLLVQLQVTFLCREQKLTVHRKRHLAI